MTQKPFWEQNFPRIIAIVIAIITFIYLLYDLFGRGKELSTLHVWVLVIILALILAPMASRLRIFNLIDFNSKLESLQKETKQQFDEIKNQISATVETRISSSPRQFTFVNTNAQMMEKIARSILDESGNIDMPEGERGIGETHSEREEFLLKAERYRYRAWDTLILSHIIQKGIFESRLPDEKEKVWESPNLDDKIINVLKAVLQDGIEVLVPPQFLEETTANLSLVESLLELRRKVESKEIQLPPSYEVDELLRKIKDALDNLFVGVIICTGNAVVGERRILKAIEDTKRKYLGEPSESTTDSDSEA